MRIGITIDDAISPIGAGVSTYISNLVRTLVEEDKTNQYVLIYARPNYSSVFPFDLSPKGDRVRTVEIPISRRILHRALWFPCAYPPVEWFTGPLDVLHHTGVSYSVPTRAPLVITVYDLFPEMFPSCFKRSMRLWRLRLIAQMRYEARYLLSISETTKNDSVRLLGVPAEKVIHTPLALPAAFYALLGNVNSSEVLADMGIVQPYFLFVGRTDPRKNLHRLLQAFAQFVGQTGYLHQLIIAGSMGTGADQVLTEIKTLNLERRVTFLGYQPLSKVVALMENAWAFIYPSLYEGFGFPLLEALACGVPIVASGVSSIPEVAGSGAHYFDPNNSEDICRALIEVTTDDALRASLLQEGKRRQVKFTWEETAQRTLQVYERAVGAIGR